MSPARFALLLQAGQQLARVPDLECLWPDLARWAGELLASPEVAVLRPEGRLLAGATMEVCEVGLRRCWESGEVQVLGEDSRWICGPVLQDGQVVALLVALRSKPLDLSGEQETRLLEFLCMTAGSTLENQLANCRTRVAFSHARVALAVLSGQGELLHCNQAMQQRLQGRELWALIRPPWGHRLRRLWCSGLSEPGYQRQVAWRQPAGWEQVLVEASPIPGGQEGVLSVTSVNARRERATLDYQETERQSLAAEMHDDLAQVLATLRLALVTPHPGAELVDHCLSVTRELIHRFRSPILEGRSLEEALRSCIEGCCADLDRRVQLSPRLRSCRGPLAHGLYRIVQEALVNVQRHSQARSVWIRIAVARGALLGCVRDDGIGIEEKFGVNRGYGLTAMRQRAFLLGGRLRCRASANGGTEVRFQLPWD